MHMLRYEARRQPAPGVDGRGGNRAAHASVAASRSCRRYTGRIVQKVTALHPEMRLRSKSVSLTESKPVKQGLALGESLVRSGGPSRIVRLRCALAERPLGKGGRNASREVFLYPIDHGQARSSVSGCGWSGRG